MHRSLRQAYVAELAAAAAADAHGARAAAWHHLERAHVLSQPFGLAHTRVHGRMLAFALRGRDWTEIVGQLPRLLLAAPATWLGRAPRGNSGGARVPMERPMPIPADLVALLRDECEGP
ncbi:MAG: DUF3703 domain-containing protein [Deltaproteobacteria bacterium]|nr:DUF3703 domain-containing protein [Deltaproteobacteria bacterium]